MLPLQLCAHCTGYLALWVTSIASDYSFASLHLESNCPLSSSLAPDFTLDLAVQALMAVQYFCEPPCLLRWPFQINNLDSGHMSENVAT